MSDHPQGPEQLWNEIGSLEVAEDERASARRLWHSLGWLGLTVALAVGLWLLLRPAPVVEVFRVHRADPVSQRAVLYASGYVVARRAATVSSKITARIEEVLVEEGQRVKRGQLLARLDDANIKRNLELAEAKVEELRRQLEEARVRLRYAERELERVKRLYEEGVASSSSLDAAKEERDTWFYRVHTLEQSLEVARKEVAVWLQELEDTFIRAPFDGVITTKDAHPGEMISPVTAGGGYTRTGICTIVDMSSLEVEVDVNEEFIGRIFEGQRVVGWLDAYPEWQIPCHVIAVVPTADREKSTVKVRVGFDQLDSRILPEMSIRLAFLREDESGNAAEFYLPRAAVHKDGERAWVWLVRDGRVRRATVETVVFQEAEIGVRGSLQEGDLVVLNASRPLREGMRVRLRENEM